MELLGRGVRPWGFRSICWSGTYALDDHALNTDRRYRRVARVAWHLRDRFHYVHVFTLPPDRVFSVEGWISGLGDEKMRVVRVWTAVGHRQTPRRVELERRHDSALVREARALGMS